MGSVNFASGRERVYTVLVFRWSWSSDGKKLAFTVEQRAATGQYTQRTWTAQMICALPTIARIAACPHGRPMVSGSRPVSSGRRASAGFVMNADGSNLRQITPDIASSCSVARGLEAVTKLAIGCRSAGAAAKASFRRTYRRPNARVFRSLYPLPRHRAWETRGPGQIRPFGRTPLNRRHPRCSSKTVISGGAPRRMGAAIVPMPRFT
jgi:hypothetical protein